MNLDDLANLFLQRADLKGELMKLTTMRETHEKEAKRLEGLGTVIDQKLFQVERKISELGKKVL